VIALQLLPGGVTSTLCEATMALLTSPQPDTLAIPELMTA